MSNPIYFLDACASYVSDLDAYVDSFTPKEKLAVLAVSGYLAVREIDRFLEQRRYARVIERARIRREARHDADQAMIRADRQDGTIPLLWNRFRDWFNHMAQTIKNAEKNGTVFHTKREIEDYLEQQNLPVSELIRAGRYLRKFDPSGMKEMEDYTELRYHTLPPPTDGEVASVMHEFIIACEYLNS